ncbi:unnamed protein product [Linum trigynum]|uniref:FAR1 domain-containing protein n=1 Tax=Linum trigynum TaxID=586398 RepID=A0AAV2G6U5_9ROSI
MDYGDDTGGVRDSDDMEDNVDTTDSDSEDDNNTNFGDDDKENISDEHLHSFETQPHSSDAPLHKDAANPAMAPPYSSMYDWTLLDKVGNGKPYSKWESDDVVGYEFETLVEAAKFYSTYGCAMGFSVRKNTHTYSKYGVKNMQRWVCSREGERQPVHNDKENRKREPRPVTRLHCPAAFKVSFFEATNRFKVKQFIPTHFHHLAGAHEVQFLSSRRKVDDASKAQIRSLRAAGIRTNQIMDYLVNCARSFQNLGFTKTDVYNFVSADRRSEILDSDSEAALAYLQARATTDPRFYCRYTVSDGGELGNMLWADSSSQLDYSLFGDVLVFDSTYKTNAYNLPFLLFIGVNNHNQALFLHVLYLRMKRRRTTYGF